MSSEKAFPEIFTDRDQYGNYDVYSCGGMTLRDYFAGQALCGMRIGVEDDHISELLAQSAYRVADAMLKTREKKADGS